MLSISDGEIYSASMEDQRISPDEYFMGIAMAVRERANCLGSRVGAIAVKDKRIVSTGYNGTPSGMKNCLEGGCHRCAKREEFSAGSGYDICICVHAEQNVLLAAARFGISVEGATIYTTMQPCFGCTKEMLQANIHSVYYLHAWEPKENLREEYQRIQNEFPGGIQHFSMEDPRADWAVSGRWKNRPAAVSE